jgi:hypothetical protein
MLQKKIHKKNHVKQQDVFRGFLQEARPVNKQNSPARWQGYVRIGYKFINPVIYFQKSLGFQFL